MSRIRGRNGGEDSYRNAELLNFSGLPARDGRRESSVLRPARSGLHDQGECVVKIAHLHVTVKACPTILLF